jgi:hypothetical protein
MHVAPPLNPLLTVSMRMWGRQATERTAAQDILVVLAENDLADWSFGNGEAQYLPSAAEPVRSQAVR